MVKAVHGRRHVMIVSARKTVRTGTFIHGKLLYVEREMLYDHVLDETLRLELVNEMKRESILVPWRGRPLSPASSASTLRLCGLGFSWRFGTFW